MKGRESRRYSGTRVDVSRNRSIQVDATARERRPSMRPNRTQLLWFRSRTSQFNSKEQDSRKLSAFHDQSDVSRRSIGRIGACPTTILEKHLITKRCFPRQIHQRIEIAGEHRVGVTKKSRSRTVTPSSPSQLYCVYLSLQLRPGCGPQVAQGTLQVAVPGKTLHGAYVNVIAQQCRQAGPPELVQIELQTASPITGLLQSRATFTTPT